MNVDSILVSEFARHENGRLTVVNTFNQVEGSFPSHIPMIFVSLIVHGHSAEAGTQHDIELRLIDETRATTGGPFVGTFTFPSGRIEGMPVRHVMVFRLFALEIPSAGVFAFEVYIDGTYHAAQSFLASSRE